MEMFVLILASQFKRSFKIIYSLTILCFDHSLSLLSTLPQLPTYPTSGSFFLLKQSNKQYKPGVHFVLFNASWAWGLFWSRTDMRSVTSLVKMFISLYWELLLMNIFLTQGGLHAYRPFFLLGFCLDWSYTGLVPTVMVFVVHCVSALVYLENIISLKASVAQLLESFCLLIKPEKIFISEQPSVDLVSEFSFIGSVWQMGANPKLEPRIYYTFLSTVALS